MDIKILNPANVPTPKAGAGEVPFFVDSETQLLSAKNSAGETVPTGGGGGSSSAGIVSNFTSSTVEANAPVIAYGISIISTPIV